jgi:predicted metal-dependent peptidase
MTRRVSAPGPAPALAPAPAPTAAPGAAPDTAEAAAAADDDAAEAARLSALRLRLVERHPFWGHLALGVRLVPAPALASFAATDCVRRIWYNPRLTRHLDPDTLGFVLLHELGHQLFASLERARGRDAHLWNCATDYAINRVVAGIRDPAAPGRPLYPPPRGVVPGLGAVQVLLEPRYDGLVAEVIYEHLEAAALPRPRFVRVHLADGTVLPGVLDHGGGVDVHLPEALTDEDREALRERVRGAIGAARDARARGDLPGGIERLLPEPGAGRVPWRRLLQRYVGAALVPADYGYRRPNRRWLAEGFLVPGLVSEPRHDVVVALDTSGSMTPADVARAADELAGLLAAADTVTVVVADASVHEVVRPAAVKSWLAARRVRGGGGTDHRPVFAWLAEERRRPDVFIGLTDLYSRFPERPPPYPVVWVTPPGAGRAPWGRVVPLPPSASGG